MEQKKKHRCEDCAWRKRAEANPRSFMAILWRLHTYVCPGWRSYQKSLAEQAARGPRN
jgi:hypothetical protein